VSGVVRRGRRDLLRTGGPVSDRHLHLLPQLLQQNGHKAVHGKTAKIDAADTGEVGGGEAGQFPCFADGQALLIERLDDAGGKDRPELFQFGVWSPEIAENVCRRIAFWI
jgi:hypothetical protein